MDAPHSRLILSFTLFLIGLFLFANAHANILKWDKPDGNPALSEYKIYGGKQSRPSSATKPGDFTYDFEVTTGNTETSYQLDRLQYLEAGTRYFFAITAISQSGEESAFSNEIRVDMPADPNTSGGGTSGGDSAGGGTSGGDSSGGGTGGGGNASGDSSGDDSAGGGNASGDSSGGDSSGGDNAGGDSSGGGSNPDTNDSVWLPITAASASDTEGPNVAPNTLDGNPKTRWSAKGDGQWLQLDLQDGPVTVQEVTIAWFKGSRRKASFSIEVSLDGVTWTEVYSGDSSGTTTEPEVYAVTPAPAHYARIVGYGNSDNLWNSILDVELYGQPDADPLPGDTELVHLLIATASAGVDQDPNAAPNTFDGLWLQFDLQDSPATVQEVAIAWLEGDRRKASFSIDVSLDGVTWTEVYSGDSSGTTTELEVYAVTPTPARYVRIVGYSNSDNSLNSILDVEIFGTVN